MSPASSTTTQAGGDGQGTVFSLNLATGTEQVVYPFQGESDGAIPSGTLINVKGLLYGTTEQGGDIDTKCASGCGTVFSLNPAVGAAQNLYSFVGGKKDGLSPVASLLEVGGLLYGTTGGGGDGKGCRHYGCGTIFSVNPKTGAEKVIYQFQNGADGAYPQSGLINIGGTLYGTTAEGGGALVCHGCGTIFSLNLATGVEQVLYAFQDGTDGAFPRTGLINLNGTLYGTTEDGGGSANCSCGTIFSFNPTTATEQIVHVFQSGGKDGVGPAGGLINVGGMLYGTTGGGGGKGPSECFGYGCGTVYSFDPASGMEAVLHAFAGSPNDSTAPLGSLIYVSGKLYGTTSGGGSSSACSNEYYAGCGIVFAFKP